MVPGLLSAAPVALRLPAVLQDDDFLQRFIGAFDDALAPILTTLDGLPAYIDPFLAPEDFLDWLGGWVGVDLDDAWTVDQRREVVGAAAVVHRRRGTARGIADAVRLATGADVEVSDNGGTTWSPSPGASFPGEPTPSVHVRVTVDDPSRVSITHVSRVIAAVKPAHVPHTVEIVDSDGPAASSGSDT